MVLSSCGSSEPASAERMEGGPDYPLFGQSMTWAGDRLLIIGGAGGDMGDGLLVDDPMAWTSEGGFEPIASPPGPVRTHQAALWTGEELMIWSGTTDPYGVADGMVFTAAAYDPTADKWRELAASPQELGKVRADGGMVGRKALFAGGDAGISERDRLVAIYDLDTNQWSQLPLSGPVLTLVADGEMGFVLWEDGEPGEDGEGMQRAPGLRLGRFVGEGGAARVEPVDLPAGYDEFAGLVGFTLVDQSLVLLTAEGEQSSILHIADLDADGEPGPWRQEKLDGVAVPENLGREAPLMAVGRQVVVADSDLHWIDIDDGSLVTETVTSVERCALETSTAVAVGAGLVATAGGCSVVDGDGNETELTGSFLFTPPQN
jgi:hypothetical protein